MLSKFIITMIGTYIIAVLIILAIKLFQYV